MSLALVSDPRTGIADMLAALVSGEGTGGHAYPPAGALTRDSCATRNLADAVHYLGVLHGRQPDLIDNAALRHPATPVGAFLTRAADGFAAERGYLARLSVAAGPLPSTPGQADCENTVLSQAHALSMLARSDRIGTALGAAAALLLDWRRVRMVLDVAAERLGLDTPPCRLPGAGETLDAVSVAVTGPGMERAVAFGAQQLLLQQSGLWDLLAARASARGEA